VTVACLEVPKADASGFGVVAVDTEDRIISFLEKPKDPPTMPDNPEMSFASMGIYVFRTKFLYDQLRRDEADENSSRDFGKDIIPFLVEHGRAFAHRFTESCVRSDVQAETNIDLTDVVPPLDLYDASWPIWSYAELTPPAKFVHDVGERRGEAVASLVSGGCIVSGARVRRSLLFTGVRANSFSSIEGGVILPYANIARGVHLTNVIVDAGVTIPEGLVVGQDPELDAKRFRRSAAGICLITQPMIDALDR
jgi:glucose-1-phosphate adenylyltransferase